MARTLNLGVLAHVDAGKTSLTERLLHAVGVLDELGSVDAGSTQTDTLALERRRGITIKTAVASFLLGDVTVNLIDTPGHPDFIAEVERVLRVLDGAVLVVSAVEGVQAQTRILFRALQRLGVPTLFFVNKVDRGGADDERTLADIGRRLTPAVVAMGTVRYCGRRDAEVTPFGAEDTAFTERLAEMLADHDDDLLTAWVTGDQPVPYHRLGRALARQTKRAMVHPAFAGSAITGAGVEHLLAGLTDLLPEGAGTAEPPLSGTVFKVERGAAGERIAYVRLFSGTVRTRDRVAVAGRERTVTGLEVFRQGGATPDDILLAGQIGRVRGLGHVRIGDALGDQSSGTTQPQFPPPTLATVIVPRRPEDRGPLRAALDQLAEQDPLIAVRQDDARQELSVSLYGKVQEEVIAATLADEYGVEVDFRETTTICIERPIGRGAAVEFIRKGGNPFLATVGLRVDPGPVGGGVRFDLEVEYGSLPLSFHTAVEETVRRTLQQGLHGWQVTDCTVTMTHSGYWPRQSHAHATFDRSMSSTGADFRDLTPLVLLRALRRAGTVVDEPVHRFHLEVPADTLGPVLALVGRLQGVPEVPTLGSPAATVEGRVPAARVHDLRQQLPGLSRGEGVLETQFDGYQPVRGPLPSRPRLGNDPLDRKTYLLHIKRRL